METKLYNIANELEGHVRAFYGLTDSELAIVLAEVTLRYAVSAYETNPRGAS